MWKFCSNEGLKIVINLFYGTMVEIIAFSSDELHK